VLERRSWRDAHRESGVLFWQRSLLPLSLVVCVAACHLRCSRLSGAQLQALEGSGKSTRTAPFIGAPFPLLSLLNVLRTVPTLVAYPELILVVLKYITLYVGASAVVLTAKVTVNPFKTTIPP
jgi:hypothetical protein